MPELRSHNKDCVYVERSKKPRPSNALIDHLEKENRRLQVVLRQSLDRNNEPKSQERTHDEPTLATSKLDFDGIDPSLGMHLLSIYFNRQHEEWSFTGLPSCGTWRSSDRYTSRSNGHTTTGWAYRQRFIELLSTALEKSEITTIQALIIIASPMFMWCDERSTSWLCAGIAFDMIIDLGIHVDVSNLPNSRRLSDEDLEVRRRIFWGAYVKDKVQSLYQGMPARLREIDTNVPLTFLDEYEELEQFNTLSHADEKDHPGFPLHSISTFKEECRLGIIMDRIIGCLYSEKSQQEIPMISFGRRWSCMTT
ncbi:nitrogen assimilation transcription factor nirA [Lipomyces starkeyi]